MTQHADTMTVSDTDSDLLRRFVRGDELAFELLVKRHQGMVLGVCRRVTENANYSEDAAQATFLLLASRAKKLETHASIVGWLHRTAVNVARTAHRSAGRRKHREELAMADREEHVAADHGTQFMEVVDDALVRLPQQDRECLVLHYVEGLSRAQIAEQLDLKDSTLSMRLTRARERLRKQLRKLGLPLTTSAVVALLAMPLNAGASTTFATTVACAAGQLQAAGMLGVTSVSPQVVSITKGVMKKMIVKKAALTTTALCVIGAICTTTASDKKNVTPQPLAITKKTVTKQAKADETTKKNPTKNTAATITTLMTTHGPIVTRDVKIQVMDEDGNLVPMEGDGKGAAPGTLIGDAIAKALEKVQGPGGGIVMPEGGFDLKVLGNGKNLGLNGDLQKKIMDAMKKQREDVLKKWDKNGDGTLDEAERKAMRLGKVDDEFDKLDTNKNGVLTKEEFLAGKERGRNAWAQQITTALKNRQVGQQDAEQKTIERFDENGDGKVDDVEKRKAAAAMLDRIEQRGLTGKWKSFDTDGDGMLKGAERDAILKNLTDRLGTESKEAN